jgi:undecaprenyl-diphosphatase
VTVVQSVILGAVQGLTEFLPVSSDGHLALVYHAFGQTPDLAFEVFLHMATLLAMIVYFWRDIVSLARSLGPSGEGGTERRLVARIALATCVSGVLALVLKKVDLIERANASLIAIGIGFLVTSAVLAAAEYLSHRVEHRDAADLGWARTSMVAVAQALAALPGISRSGSTIATGMLAGLTRESAARFAFLLGIPIIAAANLYEGKDVVTGVSPMPPLGVSLAGFVVAGVVGYLAIKGLLALVRKHTLYGFSVYTAVVGVAVIVWGSVTRIGS